MNFTKLKCIECFYCEGCPRKEDCLSEETQEENRQKILSNNREG